MAAPLPSPPTPHPPSSGASATSQPIAVSSKQKMSNTLDLQDESDMGPNNNYQPNHPAQYPQAAYSFSRGPSNFAVDQGMSMVENFTHGIQPNLNQMDNTMQESNGHAQSHSITSNPPGMAPPQTPLQQSFSSPAGPRVSMDGSQDLTNAGEGSKRKRSKVSRACDECRRKKVRNMEHVIYCNHSLCVDTL
jgi:hypothetical protein